MPRYRKEKRPGRDLPKTAADRLYSGFHDGSPIGRLLILWWSERKREIKVYQLGLILMSKPEKLKSFSESGAKKP
ncbi:hypothetical protein TNIN_393771 [Trichonephila inaurata madagascariensis]|uniref:Uncharacterized protein n=1 Tax=Trichonephila inaurata madagascariensis TaxID=2747483 RepID=A0A8X6Y7H2_9ARAC|nr:hypothetical protein TNIN_393771 [Trichonephila inaurata madagascariensis]